MHSTYISFQSPLYSNFYYFNIRLWAIFTLKNKDPIFSNSLISLYIHSQFQFRNQNSYYIYNNQLNVLRFIIKAMIITYISNEVTSRKDGKDSVPLYFHSYSKITRKVRFFELFLSLLNKIISLRKIQMITFF